LAYLSIDEAIGMGFTLAKSARYQDLKNLAEKILNIRPDDFMATYFRSLAALGLGDHATGHRLMEKAERIFPQIRHYGFYAPLMRYRGREEKDILYQRLRILALFRATDAFLISYPKCGRTWLRFMLGTYALRGAEGDPLDVTGICRADPELPVLAIFHDDDPHLKPYEEIVDSKEAYREKRVIFLTRDPRDVMVSYYFQYKLRGDRELARDADFNGDPGDFIRHEIGGLRSLVKFSNAWAANRHITADFKIVTYEELSRDTAGTLRTVIDFLGWPDLGSNAVTEAVAAGDFKNMRRLEENDTLDNPALRPPEDGNPEGFKVRRGVIGGFQDYLSERDIAWMEDFLQEELDDLFSVYKYRTKSISEPRAGSGNSGASSKGNLT